MAKLERLQKILAHAGIASRRTSEDIIKQGRVRVNGKVVTLLGTKIDPETDIVSVDGKTLHEAESFVYIALHKPVDVLSTTRDDRDRGRLTVLDLVDIKQRVYPVGRLDINSEGLILLTNDGGLAEKLTHPRYHIEKEYEVLVEGKPSLDTIIKWRNGTVELEGQPPLKTAWVRVWKGEQNATWLRIKLTEGRKRQIRLVAEKLGHPVKVLRRVRIGPINLSALKVGHWRMLNQTEIQQLRKSVGHQASSRRGKSTFRGTKKTERKKDITS